MNSFVFDNIRCFIVFNRSNMYVIIRFVAFFFINFNIILHMVWWRKEKFIDQVVRMQYDNYN